MGGIYPAIAWLATIYDAYGTILNNIKHYSIKSLGL